MIDLNYFMKLISLTSLVLVFSSVLSPNPVSAQNQETSTQELYDLCSAFPLNSRCEGYNAPIPLDQRVGTQARCFVGWASQGQGGRCKIQITETTLNVYVEAGEKIAQIDNKRSTLEVLIPLDRIFFANARYWEDRSGFLTINVDDESISALDIGYAIDSTSNSKNHTNFLRIISNPSFGERLANRLTANLSLVEAALKTDETERASSTDASPPLEDASAIEQLLESRTCIRCNLQGANLQEADLKGVNLEGANLAGANLARANLQGAYLVGANLDGANLTEAKLKSAVFAFSSLANANLERANLTGVSMQYAQLSGANLSQAKLIAPATLQSANLESANLTDSQLSGAHLVGINLQQANLENAKLDNLRIDEAALGFGRMSAEDILLPLFIGFSESDELYFRVDLTGANLQGANLSGAKLEDVMLLDADLRDANLSGATLEKIDMTGAKLCGMMMPDGSRLQQGCL